MVTQDLPPPNGFGSISIARTMPKPIIRQSILFIGGIIITLHGLVYAGQWRKRYRILRMEQMEHYIATVPFLLAEQERKFLLRLRYIRENERDLMQDHPGWKVGTLYGEPVYKTLTKDQLPLPSVAEFHHALPTREWIEHVTSPDWYR